MRELSIMCYNVYGYASVAVLKTVVWKLPGVQPKRSYSELSSDFTIPLIFPNNWLSQDAHQVINALNIE